MDRLLSREHAALGETAARLDALAHEQERLRALARQVDQLERRQAGHDADLDALRARVGTLLPAGSAPQPPEVATVDSDVLIDEEGYLEFERRFRGTPELIRARQLEVLPHVAHLAGGGLRLLDLGCGRGEWLELLGEAGVAAFGVDSSSRMVAEGRSRGLDVRCDDALEYLRDLAPESLGAVTAFHLVEHVPLPVLGRLLTFAFEALAPGGVLVLETPNPGNVQVGASAFYLDPTHLRPVHPQFLQFLAEDRGFVDAKLHFIHPVDETLLLDPAGAGDHTRVVSELAKMAFGAQDYLLVARRPESSGARAGVAQR